MSEANWSTLIAAGFSFLSLIVTSYMAIFMAKLKANTDAGNLTAEKTLTSAKATEASIDKVHTAVNSERTKMMEELAAMNDRIAVLTGEKATLEAKANVTGSEPAPSPVFVQAIEPTNKPDLPKP